MRVISGKYRSRSLIAPDGFNTRPTSDRLRETLFNILAARMELNGCKFADLYAGTGAVGVEALSRGAAHCWFAENSSAALLSMTSNLSKLGVSKVDFTISEKGAAQLLKVLERAGQAMDIVYVDPPYEAEREYQSALEMLGSSRVVKGDGVVVVEFATRGKMHLAERYGSLVKHRIHRQGDSSLAFYQRMDSPPE